MSSMYVVPPLVPDDLNVNPINVMYFVRNIHSMEAKKEPINDHNCALEDSYNPIKDVEKKQHALMQSLLVLVIPINKKQLEDVCISKSSTVSASKNVDKKDKEAKKEARKAAKMEAKNKASSTASKSAESALIERQWTIYEEKRANETGQSLTACLPTVFSNFEMEKLGDVSLTTTSIDHSWVEALSYFGEARSVAFKGIINNNCKDASTTITVSEGDNFCVVSSEYSLKCRVSAWKLFGSAMGVFSFAAKHSLQAAFQHRWLSQMDLILDGKITKDTVVCEANRFLAQFDALSSQFEFGVADVIAKSVLIDSSINTLLPNNVELWLKRLESAIQ
ncbi:hypothetical protein DICVIV_01968 [Dictyocaulus viviparus]|uniref:Uncharacterized protein n=1 Tax=Dictyocaulus viviparus TaxID=29172 RepID=A0A0D8Y7E1_DICVI|nr:hypothetical protein DICVIV_01968 [Dictyocaulus viviparus]